MTDPNFESAVRGRPWVVAPDAYAYVDPGWTALFVEALDHVGALMARHPEVALHGLSAKEKFGSLRIHCVGRLPPDIEAEVHASWRDAERRSTTVCQVCGRPGKLRVDARRWWATTCVEHAASG